MSTAAPTIAADVTVTLNDAVARELLPRRGSRGRPAFLAATRRNPKTDPRVALAGALRAIADGESASRRDADELPAVGSTITLTLPAPLALSLVKRAGMEQSDDGQSWRIRDGRESPEPRVAVTDALVAIAEDDLAAEFIEREPDED